MSRIANSARPARAASGRRSTATARGRSSSTPRLVVGAARRAPRRSRRGRRSAGSRAPGSPRRRRPVQHRHRRSRRGRARRGRPPAARRPFSSGARLARDSDSLARMLDHQLTDEHPITDELLAFIEIPKGSRNKYEYDEGIGQVVLDRFLSSSMVYPTDYGFLMGHRGRDGDPLDAMVCVSEPTFPGCVIPVKPIALFKMQRREGRGRQDRLRPDARPGLEPRRDARGHPRGAAARDHPLLLRLQAARGQGGARSTAGGRARRRSR